MRKGCWHPTALPGAQAAEHYAQFPGKCAVQVAVGTAIAGRPPHRSVRAELPHTAPTLDG